MDDTARVKDQPHGGGIGRALRLITLSLVLAVFAAFAAHHAESLLTSSHPDSSVGQLAAVVEEAPMLDALTQSEFATDTDILQIVGFGCAALMLCGMFGALARAAVPSAKQAPSSIGRVVRAVALLGAASSRIVPSPTLSELSVSRT